MSDVGADVLAFFAFGSCGGFADSLYIYIYIYIYINVGIESTLA